MPSYDSALGFTRNLLKNFKINTYIAGSSALASIPLDGGLREHLLDGYDYGDACRNLEDLCKEGTVCFSQDRFLCRYTAMRLPGHDTTVYFLAGPYLFQSPDQHFLLKIQQDLSIPQDHMEYLRRYYLSVPFIEFEDYLRSTLLLLAAEIFGGADRFAVSYCRGFLDDTGDSCYPLSLTRPDARELLEQRYQEENRMMMAVASGDFKETLQILSGLASSSYEKRLPNQLRDHKNHLIIFNTLLRKAAETGGVHPLYLDDISSQYAHKIERISSDSQFTALMREMVRKYCLLVQSYSTKGYSPIIRKVINHISLHLSDDLSLKTLSDHFAISHTYLSSLFRKETGSTLTEYVNRRRMEQALFLLNSTELYIQTIAAACGVPDLNYFTKIFKKHTGKTPSQYRAFIHRNG